VGGTREVLAALEARAAALWNGGFQRPVLAREGMRLELADDVVELASSE
jgi:hypothetical protein